MKFKQNKHKKKGYFGVTYTETDSEFFDELYEIEKLDQYDPTDQFLRGDGCFCQTEEDLFCGDCMRRLRNHLLDDMDRIKDLAKEADQQIEALKAQNAKYRKENKKLKKELTDTHKELAQFEQQIGKLKNSVPQGSGEFDHIET